MYAQGVQIKHENPKKSESKLGIYATLDKGKGKWDLRLQR